MKSIVLGLALILSTQAFATGGFYCSTPAKEYEFWGTTGRAFGNPLVSDLGVNTSEQTQMFKKSLVVGYWNYRDELRFMIVDEQATKILYKVETYEVPTQEMRVWAGTLTLDTGDFLFITCEAE